MQRLLFLSGLILFLEIIDTSHAAGCLKFQGLSECRRNGKKSNSESRSCDALIQRGRTGYCLCSNGKKVRSITCRDHIHPFTCRSECAKLLDNVHIVKGACEQWVSTASCHANGPVVGRKSCHTSIKAQESGYCKCVHGLVTHQVSCDARNARIARQEFSCDQECSLAFGKYVGLSKESLPFAVQESMATEPVTGNRTDQISIESKKIDEAQRHLREQAAKAEATARLRAQKIEKESKEKIKAAEVAAEKAKAAKMAAEKAKAEKKARIAAAAKAAANAKAKAAQQAANEAARAAKAAAAAAAAAAAEESPPPPPPPPRQTE